MNLPSKFNKNENKKSSTRFLANKRPNSIGELIGCIKALRKIRKLPKKMRKKRLKNSCWAKNTSLLEEQAPAVTLTMDKPIRESTVLC